MLWMTAPMSSTGLLARPRAIDNDTAAPSIFQRIGEHEPDSPLPNDRRYGRMLAPPVSTVDRRRVDPAQGLLRRRLRRRGALASPPAGRRPRLRLSAGPVQGPRSDGAPRRARGRLSARHTDLDRSGPCEDRG